MDVKEVMVNCFYCNKDLPCPEDMVKAERHSCYDCFLKVKENLSENEVEKIHVAIPKEQALQAMPEMLMSYAMEEAFPKLWKDKKEEFKEMSRKEIAELSFLAGIQIMIDAFKGIEKEAEKQKTKN